MRNGPKKRRRLFTGHMKLNTYLVGLSGYPTVVVDLVSEAMLVMADARASEYTATNLRLHAHMAGVWFHGTFVQHRLCVRVFGPAPRRARTASRDRRSQPAVRRRPEGR